MSIAVRIKDCIDNHEKYVADIEFLVEKAEQRQEILNEATNPIGKSEPKVQQQKDYDSQLSLF